MLRLESNSLKMWKEEVACLLAKEERSILKAVSYYRWIEFSEEFMKLKGMENIMNELTLKIKEAKSAILSEEYQNKCLQERANKVITLVEKWSFFSPMLYYDASRSALYGSIENSVCFPQKN